MNTTADTPPNGAEEKEKAAPRPAPEEPRPAQAAALIELGKVSETNGGWSGLKLDSGAGFTTY